MAHINHQAIFFSTLLAAFTLSCRSLSVKVGPQISAQSQDLEGNSSEKAELYKSWNSMEDNIDKLEHLKKFGAQSFLEQYEKSGRRFFRSMFRQFRDSIIRNAHTEHNYGLDFLGAIPDGECRILKNPSDVFLMEEYGDLRPLLQTVILSKLSPREASALNPTIPGSIDSLTKLVFFELGMKLDGTSHYSDDNGSQVLRSDVSLQVVHEKGEPVAWQELDDRVFSVSMKHQKDDQDSHKLQLEAAVSSSASTGHDEMSRDFLRFSYTKNKVEQSLELQNGQVVPGSREQLVYSRRLALYPDPVVARQFKLTDTSRFNMVSAKTRSYQVNMEKAEICVLASKVSDSGKGPDSGKGSDNPSQNSDKDPGQNRR